MKKVEFENGYYLYKLEDILNSKHMSINKLVRGTNTDFKIVKKYMNGEIMRPDVFVLARFCDYLQCDISDLIEYVRNNKDSYKAV